MFVSDFTKPVTAKALNESLAKKFGTKLKLDTYTLEQLQDARNRVRTQLSQVETKESFDKVNSDSYNKSKLMLDILNAEISERGNVAEGDAISVKQQQAAGIALQHKREGTEPEEGSASAEMMDMSTADLEKKASTKHDDLPQKANENAEENKMTETQRLLNRAIITAARDAGLIINRQVVEQLTGQMDAVIENVLDDPDNAKKAAKKVVRESNPHTKIIENYFSHATKLFEGEEDKAEIVMAAKDMVDRVTGWMEDTAEMQSESMLDLADAIRDEMGQEMSDNFVSTVKGALEALYSTMETTRGSLTQGVGMLTGEAEMQPTMGAEPPAEEPAMEPTVDQEEDDGMGAAPAATGGDEEAGREMREGKKLKENSRKIASLLTSKKK